jgi:hypothetical protein
MKAIAFAAAVALSPLAASAQGGAPGSADKPQQGSMPTPSEASRSGDTSQRGSRRGAARGETRGGPPGAGLESGAGNAMAGGRTDEGPSGGTGIRGEKGARHEHSRARANSQARGKNKKGSLQRPADTPAQINRDPKPMGSGAPMTPVAEEPKPEGRNYNAGPQPGAAGGTASEPGPSSPGGSATAGSAGKTAEPKDDAKK